MVLGEFARHAPKLHAAVERVRPALGTRKETAAIRREYEKLEKISIDYAVMEKAADVAVVEATFDWDDVGSWTALDRHHRRDKAGNTLIGKTLLLGGADCLISTDDKHLVATVGMKDVIIVHTKDATLVCPKDRANDVKAVVQEIERLKQDEYL